eukprot:Selendium_serpulae@DN10389_c0_g1_i1.p1
MEEMEMGIKQVCDFTKFDPSLAHLHLNARTDDRRVVTPNSLIEEYFKATVKPFWAVQRDPSLQPSQLVAAQELPAVVEEPWSAEWEDPIFFVGSQTEEETTLLPCGHRFLNECLRVYISGFFQVGSHMTDLEVLSKTGPLLGLLDRVEHCAVF